jgi:hypothetical protein
MSRFNVFLSLVYMVHDVDTYGYGVTPALGVIGGMLMLIGLHLMSFGFRIFRGTLGLVGFTVFGTYVYPLVTTICC